MSLKENVTGFLNEYNVPSAFFNEELPSGNPRYWSDIATRIHDRTRELKIEFSCLEQHGGEGMGDAFWWVYEFKSGDESVLVKFDGSYASYSGSYFNEWFFVKPVEVVVTQYKKI